ncbi:MAG: MbnP family copper-binding protein [Chloroflexota bacterium]
MIKKRVALFFVAVFVFVIAGCGTAANNTEGDITLQFALQANGEDVACTTEYTDIGAGGNTITFTDARFYVSNINLIAADGTETPLELEQDGLWQHEDVALLDFEDGSGGCSTGNQDMRSTVVGTVPPGRYTQVKFDLGVPFELNHLDTAVAPSPLNLPAMWWSWQAGYKFVRIDMSMADTAPEASGEGMAEGEHGDDATIGEGAEGPGHSPDEPLTSWFIHLGSTGCESSDRTEPPAESCMRPNLSTITLDNYTPDESVIIADIGALLEGIDLNENTPQPPGCMSGTDDPDCPDLFDNFALDLTEGVCVDDCVDQLFFRID